MSAKSETIVAAGYRNSEIDEPLPLNKKTGSLKFMPNTISTLHYLTTERWACVSKLCIYAQQEYLNNCLVCKQSWPLFGGVENSN